MNQKGLGPFYRFQPWPTIKGVLNPNFRPISFELKKIRLLEINFDLGFRVL